MWVWYVCMYVCYGGGKRSALLDVDAYVCIGLDGMGLDRILQNMEFGMRGLGALVDWTLLIYCKWVIAGCAWLG